MAILSGGLRYGSFAQTPYANGWDSYFYLVQVKSWVEEGSMHSPEATLIYPFLRAVLLFRGDYVQMYKIGAALLAGGFTFMTFVAARWCCNSVAKKSNPALPILLCAWTVCSPHLGYVAAQYPKNLLGLILWLGFVASLGKKGLGLWTLLWLIANYFGHRLTFALALLYGSLWCLFHFRVSLKKAFFHRKMAAGAGLAVVVLTIASRLLPGLFQFADVGRLGKVLHWPPQFAPYTFAKTFGQERLSGWWLFEIGVAALSWAVLGGLLIQAAGRFLWFKPEKSIRLPIVTTTLWGLCTCLLFPLLEWSYTGISYRFLLVFVLIAPLLWCILASFRGERYTRMAYLGAGVLVIGSFYTATKGYDSSKHDPNYADFKRITLQAQAYFDKHNLERPDLVICHNALAEYFTFTTGTDAMPWLPEYAIDSSRLWRLAAGIHPQTLRYFTKVVAQAPLVSLGNGYVLLPEYAWQRAILAAEQEADLDFLQTARSWRNPYKKRPVWLLKKSQ